MFGGIRVNRYLGFEVGYNTYKDLLPFNIDVTSLSGHFDFGLPVSQNGRVFSVVGYERLSAKDTFQIDGIRVEIDETGSEPFFGLGYGHMIDKSAEIRLKVVSRDSNDLVTLSFGVAGVF